MVGIVYTLRITYSIYDICISHHVGSKLEALCHPYSIDVEDKGLPRLTCYL